ncbi:hypothetical protein UABAM_05539 [Candidatus Uabimicrobium amorphum]|uniref:Uncharacterized protein n=1 Tax=Uabimicrobium amorphum TaxID=2596890 RepID=A0A5S9IT41_UABAM|nr:hypothetical protein UABAM_05539 [Candidatus Uabimicrobium amorphum]
MPKRLTFFLILILLALNFFCVAICTNVLLIKSGVTIRVITSILMATITTLINVVGYELVRKIRKRGIKFLEVQLSYITTYTIYVFFVHLSIFANIFVVSILFCDAKIPLSAEQFFYVPDAFFQVITNNFLTAIDVFALVTVLSIAPFALCFSLKKLFRKESLI